MAGEEDRRRHRLPERLGEQVHHREEYHREAAAEHEDQREYPLLALGKREEPRDPESHRHEALHQDAARGRGTRRKKLRGTLYRTSPVVISPMRRSGCFFMALRRGTPLAPFLGVTPVEHEAHGRTFMTRKSTISKTPGEPRIGRKDLQDPDRDVRSPRKGGVEPDAERSDREAGAGRPVQLDEEGRSRPADDAPVAK